MDKRWRILVVDDEPNNLQLMMQILGDQYQLAFAPNGMKAIQIAKKLETDLILLDVMMPEMDGYEVCRLLKSEEKTRHIPIIFVTAKDEIGDETRGLELGAIDYIAKPISPSIVKARVKNHLELKIANAKIRKQKIRLEEQNLELIEAANLREEVERISRHDLKNPLNAVISFPPIIQNEGNLSPQQTKYLNIIRDAGLTMLNMINFSIDLFKMEKGMYVFEPARINIPLLINRILMENKGLSEAKESSAVIQVNDGPAGDHVSLFAMGDELLCYSMFMNLIKNAFEATPEGEPVYIYINEDKDNNGAVIRIRNRGEVPVEIRETFFQKFVTAGKSSGTGLGTYSAKLIADTQGGSIRLDCSTEGETTMIVMLKLFEES